MVALQIRDVSEQVRTTLAARAADRGQSLQSFLLMLITEEARRSENFSLLSSFSDRADGSQLGIEHATWALDEARMDRGAAAAAAAGVSNDADG